MSELTIKFRDYVCKDSSERPFKETLNFIDKATPGDIKNRTSFVMWIDDEWQEINVVE